MEYPKVTINTIVENDITKVWYYYTTPLHIMNWNLASNEWVCPFAKNDLQIGGKYETRMESKDGTFGFNFKATYDKVILKKQLTYTITTDQRQVSVYFERKGEQTKITIVFDAENENSIENQKVIWEVILSNFKSYAEKLKHPRLQIERTFNVPPQKVFDMFTKPKDMIVWWTPTTSFDIDLQEGGKWTIIRKEGEDIYTADGKYLTVNKPSSLQYTFGMPQFSENIDIITINITKDGENGSKLSFQVEGIDTVEELEVLKKGVVSDSEKGWQMGFDLMQKHWEN